MASAVLLLFTIIGVAQEVKDSLNYETSISLGGNRRTGLNVQNNFTGSFLLKLNKSSWGFQNISNYAYVAANGIELANDAKTISFITKSFSDRKRFVPTLIHVFENSLLYQINSRQSVKLGGTITPLKNREQFWFFVGLGYDRAIYEEEVFQNSAKTSQNRSFSIAAIYLQNKHQLIQNKLSLNYTVFFVQSLEESSDLTLWVVPSLEIKLLPSFTFGINYDARFRNVHLETLPSFNDILTLSLKMSLKR